MKSFSKITRVVAITWFFLGAYPSIADDFSLNSRSEVISAACTNAGNAAALPWEARVANAVRSGDKASAKYAGCMVVHERFRACLAAIEAISPSLVGANLMARESLSTCN